MEDINLLDAEIMRTSACLYIGFFVYSQIEFYNIYGAIDFQLKCLFLWHLNRSFGLLDDPLN